MAGKIFVNYRRDDSAPYALSIAQYLELEFGAPNVFLDIDRRAGERFPKILEELRQGLAWTDKGKRNWWALRPAV